MVTWPLAQTQYEHALLTLATSDTARHASKRACVDRRKRVRKRMPLVGWPPLKRFSRVPFSTGDGSTARATPPVRMYRPRVQKQMNLSFQSQGSERRRVVSKSTTVKCHAPSRRQLQWKAKPISLQSSVGSCAKLSNRNVMWNQTPRQCNLCSWLTMQSKREV